MQLPAVTGIQITMKIYKSEGMLIRRIIFLKIPVLSRPLKLKFESKLQQW